MKRDSAELKRRMAGRWLAALSAIAPCLTEACRHPGRNVVCPIEGKPAGFRLFPDSDITGGGYKQNEGAFPNGIDLLIRVTGLSFSEVYDELLRWLDGSATALPVNIRRSYSPQRTTKRRKWLNAIWQDSVALDDPSATAARVYLRSRRLYDVASNASGLRFHPNLDYLRHDAKPIGKFPCLLAMVRSNDGRPLAIHRTYLAPSGVKLVIDDKNPCRKLTPPTDKHLSGRVVRLFPPEDGIVGVAEGLETSLAVRTGTGIPVWSCLSAGMMTGFRPPQGIRHVMIFADNDRSKTGQNAGESLLATLREEGISASLHLPAIPIDDVKKGVDFADQWARRPSAFESLINEYSFIRQRC